MNTTTAATGSSSLHVIFGAGQVGRLLSDALLARGHRVRIVRRGEPGPARERLSWLQGDVTDAAFADRACAGADVIYNCTNPAAYHRWNELLPALCRGVLGAAARAGARLVVLDNLYMYGRPSGPITEDSPIEPCSDKGRLRAELAAETLEAHRRGDVRVAIGRASDYFGPGAANTAVFMPRLFQRLQRGRPVEVVCNPDTAHSYNYTPDVAAGLAALGCDDRADGGVWHLPAAWSGTTAELIGKFADAYGTTARIRRVPQWVLRFGGVFVPLVKAVAEMSYQWEVPFVLDDSKFSSAFGVGATPIDRAVAATAEAWLEAGSAGDSGRAAA